MLLSYKRHHQVKVGTISVLLKTESLLCKSQHNLQTTTLMAHKKRKIENILVMTNYLQSSMLNEF